MSIQIEGITTDCLCKCSVYFLYKEEVYEPRYAEVIIITSLLKPSGVVNDSYLICDSLSVKIVITINVL